MIDELEDEVGVGLLLQVLTEGPELREKKLDLGLTTELKDGLNEEEGWGWGRD